MGDVDRGDGQSLVQLLQFNAHLHTQLGVEIGKRLIEQEHLGIAHNGAAERDALALAARELARLALQQALDAEDRGRVLYAFFDLGLLELPHFQSERQVGGDAHVRIERIVLEHHGDVAIHRRHFVDHPVVDADLAGSNGFEAGDHAQGRGLAAA